MGAVLLMFLCALGGVLGGYMWASADGRAVMEEYKRQQREMDDDIV